MSLYTHFYGQNFTDQVQNAGLVYDVQDMSWRAVGGPAMANINVIGGENDLWKLVEQLRAPIEIYDEFGRDCWWGYVSAVTINTGKFAFGVDLDTMYNNVKVIYNEGTTAVISDTNSIAAYGTKEGRLHLSTDLTAARRAGTAYLGQVHYPVPTVQFGVSEGLGAAITCRGWWNTLDWCYFATAGVLVNLTTDQIAHIINSSGQFLGSVQVDDNSDINTSETRAGDWTALSEINDLLAIGGTTPRRLITSVDKSRKVTIKLEPTTDDYLITPEGNLQTVLGDPVPVHLSPVGCWVRVRDQFIYADTTRLADSSRFFVEEITWAKDEQIPRITARSAVSPWTV